jgi:hypothetical protein
MPDVAIPSPQDRALASLRAIIRQEMIGLLYGRNYVGTVNSVNGDGTVNVLLNDSSMPPMQNVPIRPGSAGTTNKPSAGSQVTVAFTSDEQPFVASFDTNLAQNLDFEAIMISIGASGTTTSIQIGPTVPTTGPNPQGVAGVGDAVGPFLITSGSLIVKRG